MIYKKVTNSSPELEGWKLHLSEEEQICFESDLEDYEWYAVFDDNGKVLAVFQMIDVLNSYAKNLSVQFNPEWFHSELIEKEMLDNSVGIIIYIFGSIVQMCSGSVNKIKFHTHDKMMGLIFSRLADVHEGVKSARKYGRWVEVTI